MWVDLSMGFSWMDLFTSEELKGENPATNRCQISITICNTYYGTVKNKNWQQKITEAVLIFTFLSRFIIPWMYRE
jgi:hypothetical protein